MLKVLDFAKGYKTYLILTAIVILALVEQYTAIVIPEIVYNGLGLGAGVTAKMAIDRMANTVKIRNPLKGSGGFVQLPVLFFISIIMIVFFTACAGKPVLMSFTDVTGAERITEDQCIYRVLTPSKCRTVAHTKHDNGYNLESDTVTESPGMLQGAVQSAVHGSVGMELFDDKGSNISNDSNSTSNASASSGANKRRHEY